MQKGRSVLTLNPMPRCLISIIRANAVISLAEAKRISPNPLREILVNLNEAVEAVAIVAEILVADPRVRAAASIAKALKVVAPAVRALDPLGNVHQEVQGTNALVAAINATRNSNLHALRRDHGTNHPEPLRRDREQVHQNPLSKYLLRLSLIHI